jgi:hypothetical protein
MNSKLIKFQANNLLRRTRVSFINDSSAIITFCKKLWTLCFMKNMWICASFSTSNHQCLAYMYITNSYLAILLSILYYFGFCNFFHKSVADESFINETRARRSKLFAWNLINLLFISPFFAKHWWFEELNEAQIHIFFIKQSSQFLAKRYICLTKTTSFFSCATHTLGI